MHKLITVSAILALMLPALTATAKLYKCKDENGEISYTDQPCANDGEELKLPPLTTYTPVTVPRTPPPGETPGTNGAVIAYKSLKVITPVNDKIVFSNSGTVTIGFKVDGPLQTLLGHKFAIAVDGTQLKSRGVTNQIRLDNVEPGTHTVQVYVVDKTDKLLKASNTVTFHMRRQGRPNLAPPGSPQSLPGGPGRIPGSPGLVPGSPQTIPGGQFSSPGS